MAEKKEKLPGWDLSDLYKGIDDPAIEKDLEKYQKDNLSFAKKYKGKIAGLSAAEFAKMLQTYEKMVIRAENLASFASLNMNTQMKNAKAVAFYQTISEKLTDYGKPVVFFTLEINKLSDAQVKELLKDKAVAFYKPWLERIRRFKKYELSEELEELLLEKSLTSGSAWVRLYEESSSRLVYTVDGKNYNDAEISKLLLDKDPKVREKAGKELNRVSKENSALYSFIYNMVIKDKATEDAKRGFKTPIAERNLAENVEDAAVEALAESVRKKYAEISHRFYKLKAKWLGVKKIQYWDRNAPLPFCHDTHYSWKEAVNTVLNAYHEFSPKLHAQAVDFFKNDWIDVPPRDGKRSGAFAHSCSNEMHPYLFLNFVGKQNDVLTLAHELGHGCHMRLSKAQGALNDDMPMTLAEVASVFGEMVTFQSLLRRTTDDKDKLCLIAGKVNDMINTALRQISFHFFETRAHNERKNGELSDERLCQIWVEEMRACLGPSVVVDENSAHIWSQVGHFFFLPFYVYAYSFADCLVNSLYQVYQEGSVKNFEDKYLDMLAHTGSKKYDQLLKPFGLDAKSPEFWNKGLSLISGYIDELERLDKKLKL